MVDRQGRSIARIMSFISVSSWVVIGVRSLVCHVAFSSIGILSAMLSKLVVS